MTFDSPFTAVWRILGVPALLGTIASVQGADIGAQISNFMYFHQTGRTAVAYQGGRFQFDVRDGNIITNCEAQGISLVVQGDIDGDGIPDDGQVIGPGVCPAIPGTEEVIDAAYVHPFYPEKSRLESCSALSKLKKPVYGFTDSSVYVWFDYSNPSDLKDYYISLYNWTRGYGPGVIELARHYSEIIVPDVYRFSFPGRKDPYVPFYIDCNMQSLPNGYPGRNRYAPQGLRFSGIAVANDTPIKEPKWVNGIMEMDPRVFNHLYWEGVNTSNARSLDRLNFALTQALDVDTTILNPDGTTTTYPAGTPTLDEAGTIPFTSPADGRPPLYVVYPPPIAGGAGTNTPFNVGLYEGGFRLPPVGAEGTAATLPLTQIGAVVAGWLLFDRNGPAGFYSTDDSQTWLTWPIRLVDTWEGFRVAGTYVNAAPPPARYSAWRLPSGLTVPLDQRTRYGDIDGDGFSNFVEWAAGTLINDATSKPGPLVMPSIALGGTKTRSTKPAGDKSDASGIEIRFPRRQGLSTEVTIELQFSLDAKTWQTIPMYDTPEWNIRLETEAYVVSSKVDREACFFRMKIVENL